MKINKKSGFCAQIYFPNLECLKPFKLEFATNAKYFDSLDEDIKKRVLNVSYDPQTGYDQCTPCAGGVYVCSKVNFVNDGVDESEILCRATYTLPSLIELSGDQEIVHIIHTGIFFSPVEGDYIAPIRQIEQLSIPDYNAQKTSLVPVIQLIYPTSELPTIDYTLDCEQVLPGQWFFGPNNKRSKVYYRSITAETTITKLFAENRGYWNFGTYDWNVSKIVGFGGTYFIEGGGQGGIMSFKDILFYYDLVDNKISIGGRTPLEYVGKKLSIQTFVHYTKN